MTSSSNNTNNQQDQQNVLVKHLLEAHLHDNDAEQIASLLFKYYPDMQSLNIQQSSFEQFQTTICSLIPGKITQYASWEALKAFNQQQLKNSTINTSSTTTKEITIIKKSNFIPFNNVKEPYFTIESYKEVSHIDFSADGLLLFGLDPRAGVYVWSIPDCEAVTVLKVSEDCGRICCLSVSRRGDFVAGGGDDGVQIWSASFPFIQVKELIFEDLLHYQKQLFAIKFNTTGSFLAFTRRVGQLNIHGVNNEWPLLFKIDDEKKWYGALYYVLPSCTDGPELLFGCRKNGVDSIDLVSFNPKLSFEVEGMIDIAYSSKYGLYFLTEDSFIQHRDIEGRMLLQVQLEDEQVNLLIFDSYLVVSGYNGLSLYSLDSGLRIIHSWFPDMKVRKSILHPSGNWIASIIYYAQDRNYIAIWSEDGKGWMSV
jgi:hypothetical protein